MNLNNMHTNERDKERTMVTLNLNNFACRESYKNKRRNSIQTIINEIKAGRRTAASQMTDTLSIFCS